MTPTKPGHYWWREKDGDEWEQGVVSYNWDRSRLTWDTIELTVHRDYRFVSGMGGQWEPCPKPGEGVEGWGVFATHGTFIHAMACEDDCKSSCFKDGFYSEQVFKDSSLTCQPVTIYPREEQV